MKKNKLYGYSVQEIERKKIEEINNIETNDEYEMTGEFYDILGDEKRKKKQKKKNHLFTIILLSLDIFGVGGLGFLAYVKVYFTADRFLDNVSEDFNTYLSEMNVNANYVTYNMYDGYELKGDVNLTSNMPIYENLNTLSFIYDTYFDFEDEKAYYDLSLEHDSEILLNGEVYADKNNFYYNFPAFLSRTMYADAEESPFTIEAMDIDIIKFMEVPGYILEALQEADKETINKGLTNIYRYEINDNNKDKVLNKFRELISENDFANFIISSTYGEDWLDNIELGNISLEIEVNVITQDIVSFAFTGFDDTLEGYFETDNKFRVIDSVGNYIDIDIYEGRCNITIFIDGKTDGQINITHSDNEININVIAEDTTIELKLTGDEKNSNLYFNITYLDTSVILNLDMSTQDEEINTTGDINIEYSGATFGIEFNNSITFGIEVPIKIYDDYVDIDELTEEDATEIADGLNEFLNNLPDEFTYIILTLFTEEENTEEIPEQTI